MAKQTQTYPSGMGFGVIEVVSDPDDEQLLIDVSSTDVDDFIYLSRNQVRCLMHQLTDWLTERHICA
jgi:hypothetical protein